MAVWSEVAFRRLSGERDLAAEHYHPEKLRCVAHLHSLGGPLLGSLVSPISELASPLPDDLVYDLSAAQKHVLQTADALAEDRISTKKVGRCGDLILSRLRSYLRQVAIIPKHIPKALLSSEFIVLRASSQEDVSFLLAFILSEPVQTILQWSQDGNEHPRFRQEMVLDLPIAPSVLALREPLRALICRASDCLGESERLHADAQLLMESALGLHTLDMSRRLFFERCYQETRPTARLDAEYHQPRMQNLISVLSRDGRKLSDVATPSKRRFIPQPGKDFQYIEIGDVSGSGTAGASLVLDSDAPSRATWVVRPGDVITSTVRPIRRLSAIITEDQAGYVCSSGFVVLTPRTINPEVLLVYLRLPWVCELLDLYTTASMYPAVALPDLLEIPVALPSSDVCEEIAGKIRDSLVQRREAHEAMARAQMMVEDAIGWKPKAAAMSVRPQRAWRSAPEQ